MYPCTFAYTNGKGYDEKRVMDYECDYIHASIKGGRDMFNNLPTLEAQKAFLEDVIGKADEAHNEYIKVVAALIIQTDPAKVPKTVKGKDGKPRNITVDERMKKIGELNILLSTGVFEAAKPFLWPAREGQTYVEKTAGSWPVSWHPYIQPIIDRSQQLSGLVQEDEQKIIDKASADLDKKLAAVAKQQAALSKGMKGMDRDPSALDLAFDGGGSHIGEALPGPSPKDALAARLDAVVGKPVAPLSDLKSSPPPGIPDGQERDQRNYFARGPEAAARRLADDATIALLHVRGLTHTVGDPYGKAELIFHQKGPSCAVATQFEAMRARGEKVKIEDLAVEGRDKGYFVDYATSDGSREGGTPWGHLDSLLNDHGVKADAVDNATTKQLDAAVKKTGDAIVFVYVKGFWNDPKIGDRDTHAIYVTGAEVDSKGEVRGYYVNDTGTGEAARYISAPEFNKVWTKNLVTFQDASKH
ncbi:MAG: hypothetical protein ACHQ51_03075 [Elusimicrobiota bacterium]